MPPPLAIVRPPGDTFARAISTHPGKGSIDPSRARAQHRDYANALKQAGAEVLPLEPLVSFPDSVFIEDNAVILEGRAWLCNASAPSRRGEAEFLRPVLEKLLPVETLPAEVLIDGGDVLATDSAVFIGQSSRTHRAAVDFFRERLSLPVIPVPVTGALHLKTAACWLGGNRLLLHPPALETAAFRSFEQIAVAADEAYAANGLLIGGTFLMPAGFSRLQQRIEATGVTVRSVEMSEFEKADGGITCLSLILLR